MTKLLSALCLLFAVTTAASAMEEPIHHDLEIVLHPDQHSLSVRDTITLRRNGAVKFTLGPAMVLMEMSIDGKRASPMARGHEFIAALPEEGDSHQLTLVYTGRLPTLDQHLADPQKKPGFTDAQGTFLPGQLGWYADFNTPWLTYRASIKTPDLHRAILPGTLISEQSENGIYHATVQTEEPTDSIDLFAGPYTVAERKVGNIVIRTYFHRSLSGLEDGYLESTANYLNHFSLLIGDYPYSTFSIVSSPLPVGYGFPYLTYIGENVLRLPFIRHTSLGHEVLHSWWGNGVYVDYQKGNWAEGLTTYMADYASAEVQGTGHALEKRLGWLRDYSALPQSRDYPASSFTSKTHTASQVIGYNKIAFLFHMLKTEIGDAAFNRAIKRFWRDNRGKRVDWQAVEMAFSEESRQNLGWFFDQWLNRKGAPHIILKSTSFGLDKTTVTLIQDAPYYRLSVPVGLDQTIYTVPVTGREATITVATAKKPRTIVVDPQFNIFRTLSASEAPAILRDVTLADQVSLIILGETPAFERSARMLAERLIDGGFQLVGENDPIAPDTALLIIGTPPRVRAYLEKRFQRGTPTEIANTGTARAWAAKRHGPMALAVIETESETALAQLLRPLPHYSRNGYVVFEEAKVTLKGNWPPDQTPFADPTN